MSEGISFCISWLKSLPRLPYASAFLSHTGVYLATFQADPYVRGV